MPSHPTWSLFKAPLSVSNFFKRLVLWKYFRFKLETVVLLHWLTNAVPLEQFQQKLWSHLLVRGPYFRFRIVRRLSALGSVKTLLVVWLQSRKIHPSSRKQEKKTLFLPIKFTHVTFSNQITDLCNQFAVYIYGFLCTNGSIVVSK